MIQGIDVSHHQGPNCNFGEVAAAGYRFTIVKATEGKDYEDPEFQNNWSKLRELGEDVMIRGAYHFARPDLRPDWGRSAGELEGKWFASVMKAAGGIDRGCLPLWLDWEKYTGVPGNGSQQVKDNAAWIQGFLDVVENETGIAAGIYTGPKVWEGTLRDLSEMFLEYVLWEVDYDPDGGTRGTSPDKIPKRPDMATWEWTLWQWSGGGSLAYGPKVPGIPRSGQSAVVDINRYDGTLDDLRRLANMGSAPPVPPTPPEPVVGQGILVPFDLGALPSSEYNPLVALVQGLLLAQGYGPSGLVGGTGRPDGKPGPKTQQALIDFQTAAGLCSGAGQYGLDVGGDTWHALLQRP